MTISTGFMNSRTAKKRANRRGDKRAALAAAGLAKKKRKSDKAGNSYRKRTDG